MPPPSPPPSKPPISSARALATLVVGLSMLAALPISSAAFAQNDAPTTVWDGIYTDEQAERGKALYAAHCGDCHGQGLEGDDMSPPLAGSDFLWDWHGLSVGDLFERLRISMPEADPKSMTNQEKADVLAFMLRANKIPAGKKELPPSTRELGPIAFEAVPP